MTRGYVVIAEDKEIISAMYHNSDSYLSYLGLTVLEQIQNRMLDDYIKEYNKENPDYAKDIKYLKFEDLVKSNSSSGGFYVDYSYVYDRKKKTLSVYCYGDFSFKLNESDFDIAKFVFKNDGNLYDKWCFDKDKLKYSDDTYKTFRQMLKRNAPLSEYEALLETTVDSFYVESGRLVERFNDKNYKKRVVDIDSRNEIYFEVRPQTFYGEKKEIYFCTAFGDIYIDKSSTAKGADMKIKKIAKEQRIELLNVISLFSFIDEYEELLDKYIFIDRNREKVERHSLEQLELMIKKLMSLRTHMYYLRKILKNILLKNSKKS